MSRFTNPVPQFWLDNGDIASSCLMEFYENKNYSSKKDTYADPEETVKNTNPLKLDGQGRMPPCFGTGLYSVKFYAYDNAAIDKKGELQWTRDDVDLSSGSGGAFNEWSPVQTYRLGDIVKDNGQYYVLDNATTSKAEKPSSTPSKWSKTINIKEFTSGRSYAQFETVMKDGRLYRSNVAANTTAPPGSSWDDLSFNNSVSGDFSVTGVISSASTPEFNSGKIQIGPDAGPRRIIRNDGKISSDDTNYVDLATRKSIRVAVGGGFDIDQFVVLEKIGSTVTITSSGYLSHPSASVRLSNSFIPAEYRIGGSYGPGQHISFSFIAGAGYLCSLEVDFEGRIRVSYFDYAGAPVVRTSTGTGFSVSYTITSETP